MPRGRTATVTIALSAGTAQLAADLQKAGVSLEQFGSRARIAGRNAGAGFVEASAFSRALELNTNLNIRAVARFMDNVLKLGPVMRAAFPIIGGVMFGEMIGTLYKKVTDFQNSVKYAGETIRNTFRPSIDSLKTSNDDLAIQLAKVNMEIDKLMGKRENNLALMLAEAIKLVDELGAKTAETVAKLGKGLAENNIGKLRSAFTGEARTTDIGRYFVGESGAGGMLARIDVARAQGAAAVNRARLTQGTETQVKAAIEAAEQKAVAATDALILEAITWVNDQAKIHRDAAATIARQAAEAAKDQRKYAGSSHPELLETNALTKLDQSREILMGMLSSSSLTTAVTQATGKKEGLEAGAQNKSLDQAIKNRIELLKAEKEIAENRLKSVGATESETVALEAQAKVKQVIAELDKISNTPGAPKNKVAPGSDYYKQITAIITDTTRANIQASSAEIFDKAIDQTKERTRATLALAAATTQGYEATRQATIEEETRAKLASHLDDEEWMKANATKIAELATATATEFDAKYSEQLNKTVRSMQLQIESERNLANATLNGAAAVTKANQQAKLQDLLINNNIAGYLILSTLQNQLFNAQQLANYNRELVTVNKSYDKAVAGIQAVFSGPAAKRRAEMEQQAQTLRDQLGNSPETDQLVKKATQTAEIEYWAKVAEEVAKVGGGYEEQISVLNDQLAVVQARESVEGKTLELVGKERTLRAEILRLEAQQALQEGKIYGGFKAFFLEMEADAKQTAQQIAKDLDQALHSLLDRSSSEIAKAMTGQKTSFGKMFQEEGQQLLGQAVKGGMTKGLSKLGEVIFGKDKNPLKNLQKRDGQAENSAWWVQLVNDKSGKGGGGLLGGGGSGEGSGSDSGSGSGTDTGSGSSSVPQTLLRTAFSTIGKFLKGLFVRGGASNGADMSASLDGTMAEGGTALPGGAYLVGEHGPEIMTGVSGRVYSNSQTRRMLSSSGPNLYYSIDARGTDPHLTETRVRSAIMAAHNNAITNSVRINADRMHRVPREAAKTGGR